MPSHISDIHANPMLPLIGSTIANRFQVLSLLGRGGMSTVYKARYLEVDIPVALKIMDRSYSDDPETLERFQREASILNTLVHPNLVAIYACGILPDGHAYLALEFIDGRTLASCIDGCICFLTKECVNIFKQICHALEYTHSAAVVHRDLKPANVMLLQSPAGQLVRVLDFGLAQRMAKEKKPLLTAAPLDEELPSPTADGQTPARKGEVCGSPLYMSPEQCQGQPLDKRSDIYSLGCVMYEVLTGRPPFMGANALATLALHLYEQPQPFIKVAPQRDIPLALERIVLKALEKRPDMRYQEVSQILADFQRYEQAGII